MNESKNTVTVDLNSPLARLQSCLEDFDKALDYLRVLYRAACYQEEIDNIYRDGEPINLYGITQGDATVLAEVFHILCDSRAFLDKLKQQLVDNTTN